MGEWAELKDWAYIMILSNLSRKWALPLPKWRKGQGHAPEGCVLPPLAWHRRFLQGWVVRGGQPLAHFGSPGALPAFHQVAGHYLSERRLQHLPLLSTRWRGRLSQTLHCPLEGGPSPGPRLPGEPNLAVGAPGGLQLPSPARAGNASAATWGWWNPALGGPAAWVLQGLPQEGSYLEAHRSGV